MSKKVLSILLSLTFVFSLMMPVYAQDTEKAQFLAAMVKTGAQLKKEKKMIGKYTDASAILEKLLKGSFEVAYDFAMKEEGSDDSEGTSGNLKIDAVAKKALLSMTQDVYSRNGKKKVDIGFYSDADKMAFNIPSISDKYYYIDKNATEEAIEGSAFAQAYGLDAGDIFEYNEILKSFGTLENQATINVPKNLMDPYKKLMLDYIEKGLFKSEGTQVVETGRGTIGTEKLTLTIKHSVFVAFTEELATLIENDETLYNYLTEVYDSTGYTAYFETDMASLVIQALVDGLSEVEIAKDFKYSIYVDNAGYILRNEVAFEVAPYYEEDAPVSINLKLDTAGKDYLLDEMKLGVVVGDENETVNFIASSIGHNVPVNGVFGSDITIKGYTDSYDEQYIDDMVGAFANYTWDTNKRENNFSFTLAASDSLDLNATKIPKDNENIVRFTMNGNLVLDNKRNLIEIKFKGIEFESEYNDYTFDVNILLKPINPSDVSIPEDKDVDILSLTEEQSADLLAEISKAGL